MEVFPNRGELSVYGWEGSVFIAMRNGQIAGRQPTVAEIVRQEFEIAGERVERSQCPLPIEDIAMLQQWLDAHTAMDRELKSTLPKLATDLIHELKATLVRSEAEAELLWQIIDRIILTKGFTLTDAAQTTKLSTIWEKGFGRLVKLVRKHSVSIPPEHFQPGSVESQQPATTPRHVG